MADQKDPEEYRLRMMDDLGIARVEELPMDDGGYDHGPHRSQNQGSRPVTAQIPRRAPTSRVGAIWQSAITGGAFDDSDADAVRHLDNLGDAEGRLYAQRQNGGMPTHPELHGRTARNLHNSGRELTPHQTLNTSRNPRVSPLGIVLNGDAPIRSLSNPGRPGPPNPSPDLVSGLNRLTQARPRPTSHVPSGHGATHQDSRQLQQNGLRPVPVNNGTVLVPQQAERLVSQLTEGLVYQCEIQYIAVRRSHKESKGKVTLSKSKPPHKGLFRIFVLDKMVAEEWMEHWKGYDGNKDGNQVTVRFKKPDSETVFAFTIKFRTLDDYLKFLEAADCLFAGIDIPLLEVEAQVAARPDNPSQTVNTPARPALAPVSTPPAAPAVSRAAPLVRAAPPAPAQGGSGAPQNGPPPISPYWQNGSLSNSPDFFNVSYGGSRPMPSHSQVPATNAKPEPVTPVSISLGAPHGLGASPGLRPLPGLRPPPGLTTPTQFHGLPLGLGSPIHLAPSPGLDPPGLTAPSDTSPQSLPSRSVKTEPVEGEPSNTVSSNDVSTEEDPEMLLKTLKGRMNTEVAPSGHETEDSLDPEVVRKAARLLALIGEERFVRLLSSTAATSESETRQTPRRQDISSDNSWVPVEPLRRITFTADEMMAFRGTAVYPPHWLFELNFMPLRSNTIGRRPNWTLQNDAPSQVRPTWQEQMNRILESAHGIVEPARVVETMDETEDTCHEVHVSATAEDNVEEKAQISMTMEEDTQVSASAGDRVVEYVESTVGTTTTTQTSRPNSIAPTRVVGLRGSVWAAEEATVTNPRVFTGEVTWPTTSYLNDLMLLNQASFQASSTVQEQQTVDVQTTPSLSRNQSIEQPPNVASNRAPPSPPHPRGLGASRHASGR